MLLLPPSPMLAVLIAGAAAGLLSAPHCALMCGPIAAYSARTKASGTARYHIGRGLSYAAAGAFAGLLGQPVIRLLWDSDLTMALSWALALLMAVAAYRAWPRSRPKAQQTDALVQLRVAGEEPPQKQKKVSPILRLLKRFGARPTLLGAFSVLIPCGALWGGLVIAASSGSPLAGALAMATFSLTSGTGLLASSFLSQRLKRRPSHHRILSVVFAFGAVVLVLRPISMHLEAPAEDGVSQPMPANCPLHPGGGQ